LESQIKKDGEFKVFFYEPKSSGGDMKIRLIGYVSHLTTSKEPTKECPEPEYCYFDGEHYARTWLKITRFETMSVPMDLSEFWDYRTRRRITPSHLKNSFAYVADAKEIETKVVEEEDEGFYDLYLEESFMENEIAANPDMLGLGELTLVDRQRATPVGRPDLIFYHKENDQYVIVELKKSEITKVDLEQATRYHNWGKKALGKRLVTLLVGFWADEDIVPRLEELRKDVSGVFARVYIAQFGII